MTNENCKLTTSSISNFLGEYSCLKVELIFKREFSYYLITIYVPCCMLVIVSWVSFWLDQNAIPARVSLGVTTLLTMSTQVSSFNKNVCIKPRKDLIKELKEQEGMNALFYIFRHLVLMPNCRPSHIQKQLTYGLG